MRRVLRFIKALCKYIIYGHRVSNPDYIDRISICCDCNSLDRERIICKECGCYVLKKARMSTEHCKLNKW